MRRPFSASLTVADKTSRKAGHDAQQVFMSFVSRVYLVRTAQSMTHVDDSGALGR
jgi:hypothetical protein